MDGRRQKLGIDAATFASAQRASSHFFDHFDLLLCRIQQLHQQYQHQYEEDQAVLGGTEM